MSGLNIKNPNWNGWTSSSIHSLFSGFNTSGVSSLSSIAGDFSEIKNGSYGRLVRAYYDKIEKPLKNQKKSSVSNLKKDVNVDNVKKELKEKNSEKVDKNILKEQKKVSVDAGELQRAGIALTGEKSNIEMSAFKKSYVRGEDGVWGYDYDKDKIYKAVEKFADSYNKVIDSSDKLQTGEADKYVSNMLNITRKNADELEKIGVHVGPNSKIKVDKDAILKGDASKIRELFSGEKGFAKKIAKESEKLQKSFSIDKKSYNYKGKYNVNNNLNDLFSSII